MDHGQPNVCVRVHGLTLSLPERMVSGAPSSSDPPDAIIRVGEVGPDPTLTIDERVAFSVSGAETTVAPLIDMGPAQFRHYVVDHVVPRVLTLRRMPVMHAAGVAHADRGLLLAAPSGSGKSSLSLWLGLNGWRFYGDDGIRTQELHDRLLMFPAFSNGRVHTDAIQRWFSELADEGLVSETGSKRRVAMPAAHMATGSASVEVFVAIQSAPTMALDAPVLAPLSKAETMDRWARNTFFSTEADAAEGVARIDLALAHSLHVRGFELSYPRRPDVFPAIDALLRRALDDDHRPSDG